MNEISLRNYFAAKAMQALIGREIKQCSTGNDSIKWANVYSDPVNRASSIARDAFTLAEAMMKVEEEITKRYATKKEPS